MSKDTSWGKVASWYDKVVNEEDSYQVKVILPNILRLLGPEKGKKIIDLACGQGFFSHAFAAHGATVTGVDISPELIEIARKHAGHTEDFYISSADNLSKFKEKSFDASACVLAMQNIEKMPQTLKEVGRILKEKGKLVLVLNHPSFRIPGKSAWGFDDKANVQYRRVDEYISESRAVIDMHPGAEKKDLTYSFHRPLQAYSKSLANAGFAIARIEEWVSHKESEKGPRKAAEDRSRREIPMFVCLECIKI